MRSIVPVLALGAFSALAGPVRADGVVTAAPGAFSRIEAGILCVDGTRHREAAPDTRLGYVELVEGTVVLGRATGRVPAIPDLSFGI